MKTCDPNRDWSSFFAERCNMDASGCWSWKSGLSYDGYALTKHNYDGQPIGWRAHRLSWTAFRGPIPDGLTVDHLCFNRACCNPDHLRLLSNEENAARQLSSLRPFCSNGHEYTPENTVMRRNGDRWRRRCGECLVASEKHRRRRLDDTGRRTSYRIQSLGGAA